MSKHKMVDGRLLQMNKSYGQMKQNRKRKSRSGCTRPIENRLKIICRMKKLCSSFLNV